MAEPVVTKAAIEAGAMALHGGTPPGCDGCEDARTHSEMLEGDRTLAEIVLSAAAPHLAYRAGAAAGDRIRALETRIGALHQLTAEILGSFTRTEGGHRARVGQVQIQKWHARLNPAEPWNPGANVVVPGCTDENCGGECDG